MEEAWEERGRMLSWSSITRQLLQPARDSRNLREGGSEGGSEGEREGVSERGRERGMEGVSE